MSASPTAGADATCADTSRAVKDAAGATVSRTGSAPACDGADGVRRKVSADIFGAHGIAQFGFAYCEMDASEHALFIRIQVEDPAGFARVKYVVVAHLERFAAKESLQVIWNDTPRAAIE